MRTFNAPMIPNWLRGVSLICMLFSAINLNAQEGGAASMSDAASAISELQSQGVAGDIILQLQNRANSSELLGGPKRAKNAPKSEIPSSKRLAAIPGFSGNLRPFGDELFSPTKGRVAAPNDLPVPADYIVGVGDTVEIRYFGKENKEMRLPVERNGTITIPEIGSIAVAGLTLENMGQMLLERISKQKIGVEATVSMGPLRSIQIFLMGDVNFPGAVTTDALTTVANALIFGGGIRTTGSMRKVEIRRQGKIVSRVDLYDALLKGSDKGELRLQAGDVVFVPPVGKRVAADGEVLRPAIYELLHEKTAGDLIKLAGGLKPTAYPESSKLNRIGNGWQRSTRIIPLANAAQQKLPLEDGDIFDIPGVIQTQQPSENDFRFKTLTLEGQFMAGGTYEWRENLGLADLVPHFQQIKLGAYRPLAVVDRLDPITGSRYYLTVNLLEVILNKAPVKLNRDDRVFTFSQEEIEFLSSAQVQQVLAGKIPFGKIRGAGVIVDADATSPDKESIEMSRKAFDVGGKDKEETGQVVAQDNTCRSLIELSHIIANEGTDRFRSAVFAGAYAEDGKQLLKAIPCPTIFDNNPPLLPFLLENAVTLRGEIKNPGVIPIPEGISLDIALRSRGGLTRAADKKGIEINKLVDNEQRTEVVRDRVAENIDLNSIRLYPGYIVQVRKRATDQDDGLVRLSGELVHPGAYEIRKGEKLSELLARAGGLTRFAYPEGTIFLRPRIKEEKRQYYAKAANDIMQNALFSMTREKADSSSTSNTSGASSILEIAKLIRNTNPIGRMVVEADPTILQVRPELDVMLEPGDEILVPRRPTSILVMGEVLNPGALQFVSGKKASDYIREAGGLTQFADEKYVIAVYPNGQAEPIKISSWNFQPTMLPPGSAIYVARESLTITSVDLFKLALQVVKDMALTAASLSVISK